MGNCNPTYTPGMVRELSLDQPEEKLLSKEDKQRFQVITGSVIYLGQMTHNILHSVNQLATAMSKPSKANITAVKHLLLCLVRTTDFPIINRQNEDSSTPVFRTPKHDRVALSAGTLGTRSAHCMDLILRVRSFDGMQELLSLRSYLVCFSFVGRPCSVCFLVCIVLRGSAEK